MAMNPFPPQAYTRETLIKAYQWLQSQSPQVREVATTPDLLISLFQKAQMQGKESLERPTLQNFKNELRSLAGMMGEFDEGQQVLPPTKGPTPTYTPPPHQPPAYTAPPPAYAPPPETNTPQIQAAYSPSLQQVAMQAANPRAHATDGSSVPLDGKSMEWLEEIQRELNLESVSEALRLALSVGYGRLAELFPKRR